jgi:hypothetical protein
METGAQLCDAPRRPFLKAEQVDMKIAILFQPACKLWRCPHCGHLNRRRCVAHVIISANSLIEQGRELWFVTLTSHERLRTTEATLRVFRDAWPKLHKRINRAFGRVAYYAVPERHKDGRLHCHAIVDTRIDEKWLKTAAREVGLGWRVESERVQSPLRAGLYMGKELTKQLGLHEWPERFRHYRTSQNWPKLPEPVSPPGWEFGKLAGSTALESEIYAYRASGYLVHLTDHASAWSLIAQYSM